MEPTRLFDIIYYQQQQYPQQRAYGGRYGDEWKYFSTQEIIEQSRQLAQGLIDLGVQPGDKIAIVVYSNRPEWIITDLAIMQTGAISVPVYPTISPSEYEYIFNDAGVSYCFAGKNDLYDKVRQAQQGVNTLQEVYTFDQHPDRPYWKDLFKTASTDEIDQRMAAVRPDELATLIYTSGTTGHPKGVMLSHNNIVSNIKAVREIFPVGQGDIALSFLPLCHIFERTAAYAYMYVGINVVFTGTDNLGGETGDLQAIRPHFFTTVPRLLEKVYEKIYSKGLELTGVKRNLFFWALSLTDDYDYDKQFGGWAGLQRTVADRLIFSKWRDALGGRIKGIVTGSAPCPVKMMRIFSAAGIPIREAYGLTETSPGLTGNRFEPNGAVMGSVGYPLQGVSIKLDTEGEYQEGEGEILAAGPNIMMGYFNKPSATQEVIFEQEGQRWFRTGDVGSIRKGTNGQAFLFITDRKKELLKTSGGKYVAPAPIEGRFREEFLVEQIMVVGDKRKFVSALIIPATEALQDWGQRHGLTFSTIAEAVKNPQVVAKFQEIVDGINPSFSHVEQIKKFRLLPSTWEMTRTDGTDAELTPSLKLKRRVITDKFAKEIEAMYGE